ncbi:hypothetical protein KM043_012583 [Ampulex compressa]|nr:hypothetical protein KM043_012583 [Ampulex compressa]
MSKDEDVAITRIAFFRTSMSIRITDSKENMGAISTLNDLDTKREILLTFFGIQGTKRFAGLRRERTMKKKRVEAAEESLKARDRSGSAG